MDNSFMKKLVIAYKRNAVCVVGRKHTDSESMADNGEQQAPPAKQRQTLGEGQGPESSEPFGKKQPRLEEHYPTKESLGKGS
jgi:hypothetical protein